MELLEFGKFTSPNAKGTAYPSMLNGLLEFEKLSFPKLKVLLPQVC